MPRNNAVVNRRSFNGTKVKTLMSCHRIVSLLGGLTAVVSVSTIAAGDDWPQWRGPNRDGVSTEAGLLKEWPARGPQLLWKATGIGGGFSSVAVAKGRIFTMGDGADSSFVHALDAAGGKVVWSTKIGGPGGGGGYPRPRRTPPAGRELGFARRRHR